MEALVNSHPNYAISLNALGRAVEHVKKNQKTPKIVINIILIKKNML